MIGWHSRQRLQQKHHIRCSIMFSKRSHLETVCCLNRYIDGKLFEHTHRMIPYFAHPRKPRFTHFIVVHRKCLVVFWAVLVVDPGHRMRCFGAATTTPADTQVISTCSSTMHLYWLFGPLPYGSKVMNTGPETPNSDRCSTSMLFGSNNGSSIFPTMRCSEALHGS